jgi:hypothetical protein
MEHDRAHAAVAERRLWRPGRGALFAAVGLVAGMGLLAAACGGARDPGSATGGGTGSTTTTVATSGPTGSPSSGRSTRSGSAAQSEQLQLAHCMRAHGVLDFPDPGATGGFLHAIAAAGVDTRSATFQAALQACQQYNPAGNLTSAQRAAANAKGVEFAQCMRSHGVPDFPDPSTGPLGEQVVNLTHTGIDPSSPTYQSANSACQKVVPGFSK